TPLDEPEPDPPATDNDEAVTDRGRYAGFTEGSVAGHLIHLGSFMALGSVSMIGARMAEAAYLGILGTEALAAMGFAFPISMFLFAFASGIGTGASSVIARVYGAGDRAQAARLVTHAQLLVFLVSVAISAFGLVFAQDLLSLLGAVGEVRTMATEYLRIYMLGFPLFMLSMVGSTLLRATGSATSPGLVMAGGSVLQIGIAPLLIFGLFGFPDLGVAGAAWAYVASRIFSVALYLAILLRVRMISWSLTDLGKSWVAILHVGGPATVSSLTFPISMLVITRLLAGHGDEVVAGYTVASRVETLVHMVIWSASSSVAPFVGQNWGDQNYKLVIVEIRQVNFFCLGWGVVTFIVLALVGETIVRAIDPDPTVVMVAGVFFLIMPLSIGFMGVMHVATYCFNALGQPFPPLVLSMLRSLAFYAPLAILGNYLWGFVGIFLATAFSNVVLGVGGWYWNRMAVRRGIAKRNAGKAPPAASLAV
ncbi:MAG: MATE family efflux transporter, partial [Gammaproteobacteria bacterium]|nr:MATE family efflux transporter [Gammaproteobacteria bacterium]